MSIFPKKKFQSGGSLDTAYIYPTVGYQPVSQMPLSAGLFTPIQKKLSKDAELDPEILKKVDGLTLQTDKWYSDYSNSVNTYNNLTEAERMTTQGKNLLNKVRSVGAGLNTLKQSKDVWNTANAAVKDNEAHTNFGVENGSIVVNENGKLNTEPITKVLAELSLGEDKKQLLDLKKLSSFRDLYQDVDANDTYVNVASKSLGGTKIAEALRPTFDKAGIAELKTKFEGEYGTRGDGFVKAVVSGNQVSSNYTQLTRGIDVVYSGLAKNVRNGIESNFVTDFLSNPSKEIYSWKLPSNNHAADVLAKTSTLGDEKNKLLATLVSDRKKLGDDKAYDNYLNGIETLKKDYTKSYIMGIAAPYINQTEEQSGEYKKATGAEGDIGSESYVPKMATLNVANHQQLFNSFGATDAILVSKDKDSIIEVGTKVQPLDLPQNSKEATNTKTVELGLSKTETEVLDKEIHEDELVKDYFINGSPSVGGQNLKRLDKDVKVYRLSNIEQTTSLYQRNAKGDVVPLSDKATIGKTTNLLYEAIAREKDKILKGSDPSKFQEQYAALLEKYNVRQVISGKAAGVILIPENEEASYKKTGVKMSDFDDLPKDLKDKYKLTIENSSSSISSKGEREFWSPGTWKYGNNKTTVTIDGKTYIPKIVTIRGIMKDNNEILNADQKRKLPVTSKVNGDPYASNKGFYSDVESLKYLTPTEEVETKEEGGLIPQFIPRTFNFKPLTLNELY